MMKDKLFVLSILFGLSNLVYLILDGSYGRWMNENSPDFLDYLCPLLGFCAPILFGIYWWNYYKKLDTDEKIFSWIIGVVIILPNFLMTLLFLIFSGGDFRPFG